MLAGCGSVTAEPDAPPPRRPRPHRAPTSPPSRPTSPSTPARAARPPTGSRPRTSRRRSTSAARQLDARHGPPRRHGLRRGRNEQRDLTLYPDDAAASAALARSAPTSPSAPSRTGRGLLRRAPAADLRPRRGGGRLARAVRRRRRPQRRGHGLVATRSATPCCAGPATCRPARRTSSMAQRAVDQAGDERRRGRRRDVRVLRPGLRDDIPAGLGLDTGLSPTVRTRSSGRPARSTASTSPRSALVAAGRGRTRPPTGSPYARPGRSTPRPASSSPSTTPTPPWRARLGQADFEGCTAKRPAGGRRAERPTPAATSSLTFAQTYEVGLGRHDLPARAQSDAPSWSSPRPVSCCARPCRPRPTPSPRATGRSSPCCADRPRPAAEQPASGSGDRWCGWISGSGGSPA